MILHVDIDIEVLGRTQFLSVARIGTEKTPTAMIMFDKGNAKFQKSKVSKCQQMSATATPCHADVLGKML